MLLSNCVTKENLLCTSTAQVTRDLYCKNIFIHLHETFTNFARSSNARMFHPLTTDTTLHSGKLCEFLTCKMVAVLVRFCTNHFALYLLLTHVQMKFETFQFCVTLTEPLMQFAQVRIYLGYKELHTSVSR